MGLFCISDCFASARETFGLLLLVFGNSTVIFPFAKRTFSNTYLFGFVKLIYVLLFRVLDHTSSVERFSENFDDEVVTYLIFFLGKH